MQLISHAAFTLLENAQIPWCGSPSTNLYRVEQLYCELCLTLSTYSALMHGRPHYKTNSSSK